MIMVNFIALLAFLCIMHVPQGTAQTYSGKNHTDVLAGIADAAIDLILLLRDGIPGICCGHRTCNATSSMNRK